MPEDFSPVLLVTSAAATTLQRKRAKAPRPLRSADDGKKMQEVDVDLLFGETQSRVEYLHDYGFTAVPKGPTGNKHAEVVVG